VASTSARVALRKTRRATAALQVLSTGVIDEFVPEFTEPAIEHHGAGYVAPSIDAQPRCVLQLRVRMHELALDYDEMVEQLEPHLRPVGAKAVKEYKRRFQNLTQSRKRPAAKKRRSKSDAPAAKKSRSRSKSTAPNDAASAAAMLVGLSVVLVRREAHA
jgi:hypothetical protein